mmetsp:Transcript_31816/g.36180  ORF Transcript_31816/g.36180 Transcript_31816/m.36180 type:complete len:418 (+) Transcript_31816:26-1279(+)
MDKLEIPLENLVLTQDEMDFFEAKLLVGIQYAIEQTMKEAREKGEIGKFQKQLKEDQKNVAALTLDGQEITEAFVSHFKYCEGLKSRRTSNNLSRSFELLPQVSTKEGSRRPSQSYMRRKRSNVFTVIKRRDFEDFKAPEYPKSDGELKFLLSNLSEFSITSSIEDSERFAIAKGMFGHVIPAGVNVMNPGDEGVFWILEEGECQEFHLENGKNWRLNDCYSQGSCFGDLGNMGSFSKGRYTRALTDCKLWGIDNSTYHNILVKASREKRSQRYKFLSQIPLLSSLSKYDTLKLLDAVRIEKVVRGETIISEGDYGTKFYIVEDGEAKCSSKGEHIRSLTQGGYFGELSLINNTPRTATIVATRDCELLSLDKDHFFKILGDIEARLKENMELYEDQVQEAAEEEEDTDTPRPDTTQ